MKNFEIGDAVYLSFEGAGRRDLHNDYDFSRVIIDENVEIHLTRYEGKSTEHINIRFVDVSYFEIDEVFFREYCVDVEEDGYKEAGDEDMDWLLSEKDYEDGVHFVVRFANDACLRIGAGEMVAELSPAAREK